MKIIVLLLTVITVFAQGCKGQSPTDQEEDPSEESSSSNENITMGVDLSYVNQILDHGGTYQDSGSVENLYKIFGDYGADVVRLRLWHHPEWTAEVYEGDNPIYNDLDDVTRSIQEAKEHDMAVNLDIHYSDTWADPETQEMPEDWREINDLEVLEDSVYQYTRQTLQHLNEKDLMPEFVQVGNETNCGLMFTNAPQGFPELNVCGNNWQQAGAVINRGIQAVRDVSENSKVDTKIILHIAQPENVEWWFENMTTAGGVTDFDIIGFSYYTAWSEVPLDEISNYVSDFSTTFGKEIMIVEAAYPWTLDNADDYTNIFGENSLVEEYPASEEGQQQFMVDLTQEVIDGGGTGVMYWEPAWITSDMKDKWGTGSSWENNALFDFEGNVHSGMNFMSYDYEF